MATRCPHLLGVLFTAFDLVQLVIYQINTSKVVLMVIHLFDMIGLSLIVDATKNECYFTIYFPSTNANTDYLFFLS